jgi:hypothetical protein
MVTGEVGSIVKYFLRFVMFTEAQSIKPQLTEAVTIQDHRWWEIDV